jgi:Tfp pilus assembly protein PilW
MMRRSQSGFTLVEFMFCSMATMVMLGATFTLMNTVFVSNAGMGEMMGTQQNVRVAINTIARDITMAGTGLPSGTDALPNGLNSSFPRATKAARRSPSIRML